jgi:hypothetical protein
MGNAYLSPNGQRIAWVIGNGICIYSIPFDAPPADICNNVGQWIDPDSVRWSPDNTHIVFTEFFGPGGYPAYEPDIWVMDTGRGKVANLTDDGVYGYWVTWKPPEIDIDISPQWSSDSARIAYLRRNDILSDTSSSTLIYTVELSTATMTPVITVTSHGFTPFELAWSPTGQQFVYNYRPDETNAESSLWIADLHSAETHKLADAPIASDDARDPTFSPDGQQLLVFSVGSFSEITQTTRSRIITVSNGKSSPVDTNNQATIAAWSPDGTAVAYLYHDDQLPERSGLYIASPPGAAGQLVQPGHFWQTTMAGTMRSFTWASNNSILLRRLNDQKYVLIRLRRK